MVGHGLFGCELFGFFDLHHSDVGVAAAVISSRVREWPAAQEERGRRRGGVVRFRWKDGGGGEEALGGRENYAG